MKHRMETKPKHWIHDVRADKEPTEELMVSWSNGFDRRDVTFDQLVANGTTPGTYAYQMTRNRYTADDKYEIRKHSARYGGGRGSGGYQRDQRDGDAKRQRRR